jgi:RNA polymerase sigma-70 factor (ECF subfamily)
LLVRPEIAYTDLAAAGGLSNEEALFVARLRANEDAAYDELVREFHTGIFHVAARMLNDPSEAADVTQDIFLKVFRNIAGFRGQSSLKTWVYRIAFSEILNRLRWSRRRFRHRTFSIDEEPSNEENWTGIQLRDEGPTPEAALAEAEQNDTIREALAKLSQRYRSIVVLRDIQGFSYEEISEILGISLGTVKSRLARARKELKKHLMRYVSVQRIAVR